jgi:hypothetical protein
MVAAYRLRRPRDITGLIFAHSGPQLENGLAMLPSLHQEDLRMVYDRAPDAPTATGDSVFGQRVIGFCSGPGGDRILVEGEEELSEPPDRPLPCCAAPAGLERTGPSPVAGLPADRLQPTPDGLRAAFEAALDMREDGQFVRGLLDEIVAHRHHAWLVGGSVRDLLSPAPCGPVKDFDVTGTIGPGSLDELVTLRRRSGVGDYATWLSPANVWSVTPRGQRGPRLVEYKPLARPGFTLPAWGGGLEDDAATRDLTVNALYYDRYNGVLADPCGKGRTDLATGVMDTPNSGTELVEVACVVLRSMKFRLRQPEVDIGRMVAWTREKLPTDFPEGITAPGWLRLVAVRRWSVLPELHGRDEVAVAAEFGPAAARLVREVQVRA